MRFYIADKVREVALSTAVGYAAEALGYEYQIASNGSYKRPDPAVSVACIFGVKRPSRRFMADHKAANIHTLFFDKGYTRRPRDKLARFRVSANAIQPTSYLMNVKHPADRFRATGVNFKKQRNIDGGSPVLIAGSSQKYHDWFPRVSPSDAMGYYEALAHNIRRHTDRPIVWRPKPSWKLAEPIKDTRYSLNPITVEIELAGAHSVIVTGAGVAFHSLAMGVPTYVMPGFANVAEGIAGHSLARLLFGNGLPDDETRYRFCCNVCYQEWTLAEYAAGMWLDLLGDQLK